MVLECMICGKKIKDDEPAFMLVRNWDDYPQYWEVCMVVCVRCVWHARKKEYEEGK